MLDIHVTGLEPDKRLRALIAGNQGAGKTLLSSTFPSPFVASCEGGMLSLGDRRIRYHEVSNYKEMDEIIQAFKQPMDIREKMLGVRAETLVVDTIDAFQRLLKKQYMEEKRQDNFLRNDWGWLGEKMRSYMRAWMAIDANLVVTSHLGSESDEELGRLFYWPALEGSMKKEIPNAFDICGILTARGKTEIAQGGKNVKVIERKLQLFPEPSTPWLKDRSGKLPLEFPVNLSDDYDRLAALIFEDWENAKAQADKELEELREQAKLNAEEMAAALDSQPKISDLPKPVVVESITSDQFQELVKPFGDISDSDKRKTVKDRFVAEFGNPMALPLDRLDEAVEWIGDEVKLALGEDAKVTPEPADESGVISENVDPTLDSGTSDDVSSDPAPATCADCGEPITDPDVEELSEMQYEVKLCADDFKKRANNK